MELIQADDGSLLWYNQDTDTYQVVEVDDEKMQQIQQTRDIPQSQLPQAMQEPQPSTSTVEQNKRPTFWSKAETILFLKLATDRKKKMDNPKIPKKEVYAEIAKEMLNYGYHFSTDQCMGRMKTLLTKYKETKDHNDKSGNSNKNWEYFEMFSDYIGDRPSITPTASCSTLALKTRSETHSTRSANSSDDDEKKEKSSAEKKKGEKSSKRNHVKLVKKKQSENTKEQQEQKIAMAERHHSENMSLIKSFIAVLKGKKEK
jgi:hypothetical protein